MSVDEERGDLLEGIDVLVPEGVVLVLLEIERSVKVGNVLEIEGHSDSVRGSGPPERIQAGLTHLLIYLLLI